MNERYRIRITMLGWEVRDHAQKPSANVSFHKSKAEAEEMVRQLTVKDRLDARPDRRRRPDE